MNSYVYLYLREDGTPYYIGKGTGDRAWRKHQKPISRPPKERIYLIKEGLTDTEACRLERSLISIYGRKIFGGMLLNQTSGGTGGDTTSGKMWITNGDSDQYINKSESIPEGWRRGRSNCVFNDSERQRDFGTRADFKERGKSIKKAWDEGRVIRGGRFAK